MVTWGRLRQGLALGLINLGTAGLLSWRAPMLAVESQTVQQPATPGIHLELQLRQRQLLVYRHNQVIRSYPVAVGKPGWETPVGQFQVRELVKNPVWGSFTDGRIVPAGHPKNPLGKFWIGFWTDGRDVIGFHGTPYPETVGKAISHGCIRLYNRDVQELFGLVGLGTPVVVKP
ncbi:MAG: L,D-transpeptidase [Gloeomargaritaceae cyanobacterium C42_A2020_066]|nr:L,D-transpeptidase [Gloeomargaritaceae cyanobacterium C42_A2020_066]